MDSAVSWRIVPMEASHLPQVLEVHRRAFAGYAHVALGDRYLHRMLRWYATSSRSLALVAVSLDHRVGGYVFGTDAAGLAVVGRELRRATALGLARRPWLLARPDVRGAIRRRLRQRGGASTVVEPGRTWSLVGVAVAPEWQHKGAADLLMRAYEEGAWQRGATSLSLSVFPGNRAARSLYARCGWTPNGPAVNEGQTITYVRHPEPASRADESGGTRL